MKKFFAKQLCYNLLIIFSLIFIQSVVLAHDKQNTSDKELVNNLLQLTYNCQFKEAKALVEKVLKNDSLSIEWNYFDAMILYHRDYDQDGHKFVSIMDKVIKIGENRLAVNSQDTIALFYTGGAYGYLALYSIERNTSSTVKAFSTAKKGMNLFEKLIEISPNYYDAYLYLGMYHAFASDVPWYVKPFLYIFGMSGDKEKGVEYLTLVSTKGTIAVYEAKVFLAALYFKQNENEKSLSIYRSLVSQFPQNYFFVAQEVKILCAQKRYSEAVEISDKLLELSKTSEDIGNAGRVFPRIAELYTEQGNNQKAIETYKALIKSHAMVTFSYAMIGQLYEKEKDYKNAIEAYKKSIEQGGSAKYRDLAQERLDALTKNGN